MLGSKAVRSFARRFGVNVYRHSSDQVFLFDYPVSEKPRYGFKTPPHPQILDLLEKATPEFEAIIAGIRERSDLLAAIKTNGSPEALTPYWNNGHFPSLDACVLMHLLLKERPKQYIEIGSGNSTIFAHRAKQFGGLSTKITSIDPVPRVGIDSLCDVTMRSPLEDLDLSLFDTLEAGDILFFDGSHRVFADSDVTVFFLDVLPRIKPGVLIHVHDIFWPLDYPKEWGTRYYSEQYMLAMLLVHAPEKYRTIFASAYASTAMRPQIESWIPGSPVGDVYGTSYWITAR